MEAHDSNALKMNEDEIMQMIQDTSNLIAKQQINNLSAAAVAAQQSNALANDVEFWKWMDRNYKATGIFSSPSSMQDYINTSTGKYSWLKRQVQGKGYEWDWMMKQRQNIGNAFKTYYAGDVSNQAAIDVTERNVLNGQTTEYQMKAYTSKTNPNLKNTPKDVTIVTNKEKVDIVRQNGYKNVEEFQDSKTIKQATQKRMKQVESGKAYPSYNVKNVAGTMAKAGIIGFAIGIGTETLASYRLWKNGNLSTEDYLKGICGAGGDAGVTGAVSSGLMIPVSAAVTVAGITSFVTIPIGIVLGSAVNRIVAPCFGRGKYRQYLEKAVYYQNIENAYNDMMRSIETYSEQFYLFACSLQQQSMEFQRGKDQNQKEQEKLEAILLSI